MGGGEIVNLFVLIAVGVIIADLVKNWQGTTALFGGIASLWQIGVNGMLGQPTQPAKG